SLQKLQRYTGLHVFTLASELSRASVISWEHRLAACAPKKTESRARNAKRTALTVLALWQKKSRYSSPVRARNASEWATILLSSFPSRRICFVVQMKFSVET